MNNENENTVENKDFVDVNITNKKEKNMFDINKIVSYGAIILSIVAISLFIKIEYFKPINQVFYVDNANIRAM